MSLKTLNFIFSFILVIAFTAPTIVQLLDKNCDLVLIYEISDNDTDKEEKESKEILELKYFVNKENTNTKEFKKSKGINVIHLSTFEGLHSENISPPPEII